MVSNSSSRALRRFFERTHVALFEQQGVVELAADCGLEAVGEPDCAEVLVNYGFDLGDAEIRQVAQVLLATATEEVEVRAAVAFGSCDEHSVAAAVTPEQSFEPVVMVAFTSAATPAKGEDALNTVVGLLGDERLVPSGALLVVVGDESAVVAVAEDQVELAQREGFRGVAAVASGT